MQTQLEQGETARKHAVAEALASVEKERDQLATEFEKTRRESQTAAELAELQRSKDLQEAAARKDTEIQELKAKLGSVETEQKLALKKALEGVEKQRDALANDLKQAELQKQLAEHSLKDKYETQLKDRDEKGCEYAILVSLLEPESELYNSGIVDVGYRYPKMYVIRPQFFIPMITLLRNAAMNALQYKAELALVKSQSIDVTNFEDKLEKFKDGFAKNYELAGKKFQKAIDEIDKSIDHLQMTRDALLASDRQLRLANDKAQEVTIKKLTYANPTMKAKFDELESTS